MTHAGRTMEMSDRDSSNDSDKSPAAKVTTRIDPPHLIGGPPADVDVVEADAAHASESVREREMATVGAAAFAQSAVPNSVREEFAPSTEQLQLQADQIADHLR